MTISEIVSSLVSECKGRPSYEIRHMINRQMFCDEVMCGLADYFHCESDIDSVSEHLSKGY